MNSNQIKSVNNINPTSDADIRYSSKREFAYSSKIDGDIGVNINSKATVPQK